jgi:hypothetical protein
MGDSGMDMKITSKYIFRNRTDKDWIQLAQDKGKWHTFVNAIINLQG